MVKKATLSRTRWNDEEKAQLVSEVRSIQAANPNITIHEALRKAQRILPKARRRDITYASGPNFAWLHKGVKVSKSAKVEKAASVESVGAVDLLVQVIVQALQRSEVKAALRRALKR